MNKYKSFSDLAQAFDSLKRETFLTHRGCLITKCGDGFMLCGRFFPTLKAVDDELDRQFGKWNTNIIKQNNG